MSAPTYCGSCGKTPEYCTCPYGPTGIPPEAKTGNEQTRPLTWDEVKMVMHAADIGFHVLSVCTTRVRERLHKMTDDLQKGIKPAPAELMNLLNSAFENAALAMEASKAMAGLMITVRGLDAERPRN